MTSLIRRYRGLEDRDEYDTEMSRAAKAVEMDLLASILGVQMQASIFSSASVLAFLHGPRR
jgi:hypothetical protein